MRLIEAAARVLASRRKRTQVPSTEGRTGIADTLPTEHSAMEALHDQSIDQQLGTVTEFDNELADSSELALSIAPYSQPSQSVSTRTKGHRAPSACPRCARL